MILEKKIRLMFSVNNVMVKRMRGRDRKIKVGFQCLWPNGEVIFNYLLVSLCLLLQVSADQNSRWDFGRPELEPQRDEGV